MRVLLVGNYPPDAQQSMLRFGELLKRGLPSRGWDPVLAAPRARWRARTRPGAGGSAAKWLGYLDKYVAFPRQLRRTVSEESARGPLLVHVVDHSNAVYVPRRTAIPWMATCHDLLAVRGALGEDTDCPASALGRLLQARVLAGLRRASAVACDSKSTQGDLARLAPDCPGQLRRVIPLGQNYPYRRAEPAAARASLAAHKEIPWEQPFLIHVGSNLPRKNKCAVIDVLGRLRERWAGNAVFCGAELNAEMKIRALANGVAGRVFALAAPSNVQLEAAYSLAHALVYPSTCEGFGWPVIEAQACGCPVISSDRTSLPEVGGGAALTFAPDDIAGMAEAVLALAGAGFRSAVVERGLANAARFGQDRMIDDYVAFYGEVMAGRGHA